ncbi:hypothetical protein TNCV_1946631 [Trichonephila clavipes]|uniref:Uncharacterized protein n=1 Tax=Trichonephila clavipes TaxID=2585209 RepID=A0A8X6VJM5_TRICX|nr:hypothetical protein TNCV_1946631 [Trichonephila clavipes]
MHVKSFESSNILPLVWYLGEGFQLRCSPRHLTIVQNYEHNRFNLLRIIRCPLVPSDTVCRRVELLQGAIALFTLDWKTTGIYAANGMMNGGLGYRNGTTLCSLTNPTFACNITTVGFKFEDTVLKGC